MSRITAQLNVPFQISSDNIHRIDDTDQHKALREALANTLIHANYYGRRGIVIVQDLQQITSTNPGSLRILKEEALGGGVSDPRNSAIFKMFAMINIGERAGSGLANLKHVWKQHHMKEPNIYEKFSLEQTILEVSLMKEDGGKNEEVAVNDSKSSSKSKQKEEESFRQIIEYLKNYGSVTSTELSSILNVKISRTKTLLKKLIEQNKITYTGIYRNRRYQLPKEEKEK